MPPHNKSPSGLILILKTNKMKNIKFDYSGNLRKEAVNAADVIADQVGSVKAAWLLVDQNEYSEEINELGTFYKD